MNKWFHKLSKINILFLTFHISALVLGKRRINTNKDIRRLERSKQEASWSIQRERTVRERLRILAIYVSKVQLFGKKLNINKRGESFPTYLLIVDWHKHWPMGRPLDGTKDWLSDGLPDWIIDRTKQWFKVRTFI